ncbi:MAG: TRAP transporter large permease subunit, partial [Dehalococcoidia bacterium]
PLFLPVIATLDIDPIWFAMVLILATQIGLITPPMGINIYAVKGIAGPETEVMDLFRAALPFFISMVIALLFVILFPPISTWIPYHMLGR